MRFEPKTEQELEEDGLLPKGTYDFEVIRAEDKQSKKGNDMIALGLKVFAPTGGTPFVNDYLLEAMAHKLHGFCEEVGLSDKYESGSLAASDCMGRSGKVRIDIEKGKGDYPSKNVVKGYGGDKSTATPEDETDVPW